MCVAARPGSAGSRKAPLVSVAEALGAAGAIAGASGTSVPSFRLLYQLSLIALRAGVGLLRDRGCARRAPAARVEALLGSGVAETLVVSPARLWAGRNGRPCQLPSTSVPSFQIALSASPIALWARVGLSRDHGCAVCAACACGARRCEAGLAAWSLGGISARSITERPPASTIDGISTSRAI